MKISIAAIAVMACSVTAAGPVSEFRGWNEFIKSTPDIVLVRCLTTPAPKVIVNGIQSEVEILSVLKGKTQPGTGHMVLSFCPKQREHFLIFSTYQTNSSGPVYAVHDLAGAVPLGAFFNTNLLSGKSLESQIRFMLQYRLDALNRELHEGTDEKQRLEEALR